EITGAPSSPHVPPGRFPRWDPDCVVNFPPLPFPMPEPLHPLLWPAKIFQLHLLKLPRPESEIARIDFVAKGFPDLRDAERQFLAGHLENVLELNKNRLSRFRPQICNRVFIGRRADMRLEHEIE